MDELAELRRRVSELEAREVEHKRVAEALRRRNHELALLNQAGRAFSSSLDLDQVLATVLEEVRQLLDATGCSLWLIDPETGELVCRQTAGPQTEKVQGWRLEPGQGLVGWVAQTGKSLSVPDLRIEDRHFKGVDRQTGLMLRSAISVPLEIKGRVIGVLQVLDTEVGRFSAEDLALLGPVAASAAIAIENAQLFEQARQENAERMQAEETIRRHNRELAVLNRVITAATSTLHAERVLQVACEELARAFELPQAAALLLDAEGKEATVVAEYLAPGRPSGLGKTVPVEGNPTAEYVLKHQTPLAITDAQTDERLAAVYERMRERGTVSLLIVPIPVARGRIAGTIGLDAIERRKFSRQEIALAQSVAAAAGQVLETARLYQALRRHAERLQEMVAQRTAELQVALARAQDADRVKSVFISNVSHELRTPLTNLKLFVSLLNRGPPEKRQEYLDALHRETERLQDLIEDLLDLSRLDLGETHANLRSTDLDHLLDILVDDRAALVADRGLVLEVKKNGNLHQALADPKLFEQVLTNLLANAINYTPKGGTITLDAATVEEDDQRWATVSISDTGPGIPEEDRKHLFERFYRGEAGRASDAPGTGLGLAICKEIMDLHGGRITVESQVGQGSTFTVWLPLVA